LGSWVVKIKIIIHLNELPTVARPMAERDKPNTEAVGNGEYPPVKYI